MVKLFTEPKNRNYCATIVKIATLVPLPKLDRVKAAIIFGNQVIVDSSTQPGDVGLFFPIETQLSNEFLANNNLYRDPTLNIDANKKGFFELNGRIRAIKFQGNKSEGFFVPLNCLEYVRPLTRDDVTIGTEFDAFDGHEVCKKYVVRYTPNDRGPKRSKADKKLKRISRLVENQFKFHIETLMLHKNMHKLNPDDYITISDKWHGTSWIVGNVLTLRPLKWYEKLALKFGVGVKTEHYDYVCSSRKVVKDQYLNEEAGPGFYGFDLWTEIKEKIKEMIPKGFTLYGEAVGYLPNGASIQKGYHYGCDPGKYEIFTYRITFTNEDGRTFELSDAQIKEFCCERGLSIKKQFYAGKAKDLFPAIPVGEHWHENWLLALEKRSDFNLNDSMCPSNNFEVPAEGVVVRVEKLREFDAYKLKNWKFFEKESLTLDSGEVDIESQESEEEDSSLE
jgi:hypothetical protein